MIDLENYSSKNVVVDAGKYEVVILSATPKTNKNGDSSYLNICFKIREDVDQKFNDQNVCLFTKLFKDKNNAEWYDLKQCASLLATQKDNPNYRTKFEEADEFIQYINGISLAIDVEKVYDEYWGEEVNKINFIPWRSPYHKSEAKPYVKKDTITTSNADALEVKDEDLPF